MKISENPKIQKLLKTQKVTRYFHKSEGFLIKQFKEYALQPEVSIQLHFKVRRGGSQIKTDIII